MKSYFKFLSRNKAYSAIDVFGLAISMMFVVLIGCYTWQETHVDKQHTKADRMYWLGLEMRGKNTMGMHWHVQHLLKDKFPEIENATGIYRNTRWLTYDGDRILTRCYFVDSTFYEIFDFKLIQGNPKTVLDNPSNIIVTPEYARKVWGDGDPMGKSIIFNQEEEPFVVAGVMEPMTNTALMRHQREPVDMLLNFKMLKYVNESLIDPYMPNATGSELIVLAKEGYDLTKREKEYEKALKEDFWILRLPEDNIHLKAYPFKDAYFSEMESGHINFGDPKMIRLLFGIGTVILLFAVMNYINLTVALAGKRAKEMATRRLLGEGRMEIMWRLIGESALLCSTSMLIGIALAYLMAPYASALIMIPIDITGCINLSTIAFLITALLIMSIVSGIIPALLLSSMKPIEAVKGSFKRKSNMIFGKIFIVLQNVATITMVACAVTMYFQVRKLIDAPLGYEYEGLIHIEYQYTEKGNEAFREELQKLPCVEKVSYNAGLPHNRGNNNTFTYEGRTISSQVFIGDSIYFDILGLKVEKDNQVAASIKRYQNRQYLNEIGLDENASETYFNGEWVPLAGVLEDFKIGNILTEQKPVGVIIARPFEDFFPWGIVIKIKGDETEAVRQIKEAYGKVYGPEYSDVAFSMPFIHQQIAIDFDYQKRLSKILTLFAIIAIIISMLGLTAMSTYYVSQRAQDIAVHKVMGGSSAEVLVSLVRTFMLYVLIAAVISIPIIYYVMNDWLSQFSYRIPVYWWIYAVSALLAIIICFISVIIQCRRAANTNPINSLK